MGPLKFPSTTEPYTSSKLKLPEATVYGSFYNYISVGIPFSDNFAFVIKNAYLGGNPIDKKGEMVADLNKTDRLKREYSSFAVCVRFNLPSFASDFITPYVELTGGLQIYKIFLLMNQLDDESMPAISPPSYMLEIENYFPLLSLEGGLTVLPENLVAFSDTGIQIELFGGVNYLFAGDTDAITIYRYVHRFWQDPFFPMEDRGFAGRFIPYFGFGVKFGFDL